MSWKHRQGTGILGREQGLGNLGMLPGGSGLGTGLKTWVEMEAGGKDKKIISGEGDGMSQVPEVGQVEAQTVGS